MFPGNQISWYFECSGRQELQGSILRSGLLKSDLLSYSKDLTTTGVCPKMVLKIAIFEVLQGPNHH